MFWIESSLIQNLKHLTRNDIEKFYNFRKQTNYFGLNEL